ncbi:MAG: hypothetical protein CVU14_03590 [Bacteroidetes bacterium HGW-Bacteroidetes-9]|jgi:M6 family metalloprotease-like protein|nr:MAG: hypothetical protein CVU14_03590 [Bacteroidetes bacterium HGW-Bacteroidetes-9]
MKRFLLLITITCLFFTPGIYAANFNNEPYQATQPDGSVINCFVSGDEYFNWMHDAEGFTIIQAEDGFYYYGITDKGLVIPSGYRVNSVDPESVGLTRWAKISKTEYNKRKSALSEGTNRSTRAPHLGTMNNLIVYIKFSDDTEFTTTRQTYDNMFNLPTGNTLKSYYTEVSYNQFTINSTHYPDCAMTTNYSYTDTHARNYFEPYNATTNPSGYNGETERRLREHALLRDAINWINANSPVPTGLNIDGDNDNNVDNVCFIVRGGNGAWASLLWAHRWALYTYNVYINGKRVYDYTFQPETQVNVRTLCHEMFHALGAPDLYHYDDGGLNISPVSSWDLMESGGGHMGAYMKYEYADQSWVTSIPEITTSGTYTLNPLTSATNNCYKIASPNSTTEFFIVEYRQKTGTFEGTIPGSGLIVYRIDPAQNGNADGPPDEVYIYRPNGTTSVNGSPNSAYFSSTSGRTAINDGTNPSSFLQNGSAGGLNIFNVTTAGTTISFDVGISNIYNPSVFTATTISGTQINLSWQKNAANNNVMLAFSTTPTFGSPQNGTTYNPGNTLAGGGTVLLSGGGTSFNHTSLSPSTTYYYKIWSFDGTTSYSSGASAQATTTCGSMSLPLSETFSGNGIPACWTQQVAGTNVASNWTLSATNNAGGTSGEMVCTWQDKNPATNRLVTAALNTTGVSSLNLSFRHMFDDYGPGATLRIQSSTNGTTWTNEAWSLASSADIIIGPEIINTTISSNLNSQTTYIAFTVEGNLYQFDYWYIDNVSVTAAGVQSYTISASANPTAGGTTTGGGTYNSGAQATLTATPATGYTFTNWTESGNVVSTNASYAFNVSSNRTLVANFVLQQYTIAASANPTAGGTVSGAGSYSFGSQATLLATANTGYSFTNWTEGGNIVSTNASYAFNVSSNRTLVANFVLQQYTIAASANPTAGGTVSGAGSYSFGSQATLLATANTGYTFTNWTEGGNIVSTNASYAFNVSSNRTLVANFALQQFTITASANPTAGGTATGAGSYSFGSQATLLATANTGYSFTNWTEAGNVVSTNASYTFNVSSNRTLVANFLPLEYTISVSSNPPSAGSVTGGGSYAFGSQATVTASANTGWNFTNWTENGNVVTSNVTYTFTVNGNRTLVANYTQQIVQYTITTSANPVPGGSATGGGVFNAGEQVTVNASPNTGWVFVNWTDGGTPVSTDLTYSFTATSDRDLIANFTQQTIQYTITTASSPVSGGSTTGDGLYDAGSLVTVTASPNSGRAFINWTENNTQVSSNQSFTFTATSNRSLVANFAEQYTITSAANPAAGGYTTGNGIYTQGETVTLQAYANSGYVFQHWTENGNIVSTQQTYSFTATANQDFEASFFIPVGIEKNNLKGFEIYPNPTTGIVTVETSNLLGSLIEKISVISITGKELLYTAGSTPVEKIRLDLSQFPEGLYFFRIKSQNQKESIVKVIIER